MSRDCKAFSQKICRRCLKSGHIQRDCPLQTLSKGGAKWKKFDSETSNEQEEEGKSLILTSLSEKCFNCGNSGHSFNSCSVHKVDKERFKKSSFIQHENGVTIYSPSSGGKKQKNIEQLPSEDRSYTPKPAKLVKKKKKRKEEVPVPKNARKKRKRAEAQL
eukprot:TRINITY_DN5921_c0_g1_i2.p1 TRINITY_DN5921_c0_g1~~TRINITY_DN5921_c0_g1_i2.p1  ORF type:complete len:161 (-),score=29.76 TRINITY_DN5921_c0_g1_i2:19-501(-)